MSDALSERKATQLIRRLEPQSASEITSATLEAALVVINNELVVPTVQAALRAVRNRERDGYWRTNMNDPPQVVWHACIILWRLQRTIAYQAELAKRKKSRKRGKP